MPGFISNPQLLKSLLKFELEKSFSDSGLDKLLSNSEKGSVKIVTPFPVITN